MVDEMPVFRGPASPQEKNNFTSEQTGNTQHLTSSPNNGNILSNSLKNHDEEEKQRRQQLSQKALMYYPEENHMPSESMCKDFNARVMKHLMKGKMNKNQTFY